MALPSDDMLHTLADELIFLKRTRYSEWVEKDLPFHAAFFDLMKKYKILGGDWYATREAIGSILGNRPRKVNRKPAADLSAGLAIPMIEFSVKERSTERVILKSPMMGDEITYVRIRGIPSVSSWTGNPPPFARNMGLRRAEVIFLEEDEKQAKVEFRIWLIKKNDEEMVVSLGDRFVYTAKKGKHGSVVGSMKDLAGKAVKQSDADADLLQFVRASARNHFRDTKTLEMFA